MSDCPDHGSDESPWMCVCTKEKIARLEVDKALLTGQLQASRELLAAAEAQAKLAWERHGEKDAAYQKALDQRDQAEANVKELAAESLDYKAKWLDACHNHKVVSENRDAAIAELEAKLDAVEIDNIGHAHALSMLRGLFGLPLDGTMYDEIWQRHLELLEADNARLRAVVDYVQRLADDAQHPVDAGLVELLSKVDSGDTSRISGRCVELGAAAGSACRIGHVFMFAGTLSDGQIPEGYPCACGQTAAHWQRCNLGQEHLVAMPNAEVSDRSERFAAPTVRPTTATAP